MSWLLTGGAGYIGSHVLRAMRAAGLDAVVLDDLSTGDARRVPAGVPFVEASVLDGEALRRVMHTYGVTGVIHLASKKSVEESMDDPLLYYRENVVGALTVLQAMAATGVRRMVFSSSAAVHPDWKSRALQHRKQVVLKRVRQSLGGVLTDSKTDRDVRLPPLVRSNRNKRARAFDAQRALYTGKA